MACAPRSTRFTPRAAHACIWTAASSPTRSCRGDFDACWEADGVDADLLDPVLLDLRDRRRAQKAKYGGELFVADSPGEPGGRRFIDFFQRDRVTGAAKGIVAIDLEALA